MPNGDTTTSPVPEPGTVPLQKVEPEDFRRILENWFGQSGGDPPLRSAIDPFFAPRLAGNILLLGVEGDDIRYRIVGEEIRVAVRHRLRGLSVREALGDTDYARLILAQFTYSIANRCPLYSVHSYRRPGDAYETRTSRILMPYADDSGRVVRLLAYQIFKAPLQGRPPTGGELLELIPRTVFRVVP